MFCIVYLVVSMDLFRLEYGLQVAVGFISCHSASIICVCVCVESNHCALLYRKISRNL